MIAPIVTRGFGHSIKLIVTRGYAIGEPVIPPPPAPELSPQDRDLIGRLDRNWNRPFNKVPY